jgi:predicted metalloprotease with PDZ domain
VEGLAAHRRRAQRGRPRLVRSLKREPLLALVALFAGALPLAEGATPVASSVVYRVELARAGETSLAIALELPSDAPAPAALVIPRAVPMGYSQQEYDRYVSDVTAFGARGEPLTVAREEGPRWRLGASGSLVRRVAYRVDLARMEREILGASDSSRARPEYASLLGYSVFGYVEGWEARPVRLEVEAPANWPAFTTLAPAAPPALGRAAGDAADFYALADSQVTMGPGLTVLRLESQVPLYLSAYSEGSAELAFTGGLVTRAMDAVVSYFGSAPFPHYSAVLELLKPVSPDHRYGFSMEHLESSHYFLAADEAVTPASPPQQQGRALFNFAHHLAHAWIPKRAYGEGYFPFSWELAPLLDTIWLSEGFARYIAIEALADAMPEAERAAYRASRLEALRTTLADVPAFIREMPLVPLSRIASTRYSEDFRTGRTLFARGALLAAALDERIRTASGGRKRFRDAARSLMDWSRVNRRGFRVDELPGLFLEATGVETKDVWERWLAH